MPPGLINFILGWGVLKGWGGVWWGIVIIQIVTILNAVYNGLVNNEGQAAIGVIVGGSMISIIILQYMNSKKVKTWFGIGRSVSPSTR